MTIEKVSVINEICNYNSFLGHVVLNIMTEYGFEKFNIQPAENGENRKVDVDLKINGVDVSFRSFVKLLEDQHESMVKKAATKMFTQHLKKLESNFNDMINLVQEAKYKLRDKLQEAGLFDEREEY